MAQIETSTDITKGITKGSSRKWPENWHLHALMLLTLVMRLLTMPRFVEGGDGLYFVRGVERYAMLQLRPHRPGFPVYIWLGKLFTLLNPDPVQGLHLLAILASTLTIWPIAQLAASWRKAIGSTPSEARLAGFSAGLIWALIPLSWLNGSEIYSDPVGLAFALWMLWASWRAIELKGQPTALRWLIAAAILAGLMLGVRLSYGALLLPLAYAVLTQNSKFKTQNFFLPLLAFVLTVGLWLGWQVAMEGPKVLEVITNRAASNYQVHDFVLQNGGDGDPATWGVFTRAKVLTKMVSVYGVGGWWPGVPEIRLLVSLLLAGLLLLGGWRLIRNWRSAALHLAVLWSLPYFVTSVQISHDLNMARYTFPLVALLCIVAGLGLPSQKIARSLALFGLTIALLLVTGPLALQHRVSPPLGQRLADFANIYLDPAKAAVIVPGNLHRDAFINLFMFEKAPGIPSGGASFATLPERTKLLEEQGRTVYATFRLTTAPADWRLVAVLRQNRFMDSLMDADNFLELGIYRHDATKPG